MGFILKLIDTTLTTGKIILLSKPTHKVPPLAVELLKNKVLILGNGPSLAQTIEKYGNHLNNYSLVAVNNMAKSDLYEQLKPSFYVLNATTYFQEDDELSPMYIEMNKVLYEEVKRKTNWPMVLVVPVIARKSKKFLDLVSQMDNLEVFYFNQTPVEGLTAFNHFFFKRNMGMPRPHNVLIPALMSFIYLKAKEIYICGADHTWLGEISVTDKNDVLVNQKHFYDHDTSKPEKMEDFIDRPRRLHEVLEKFYLAFKGYWVIKDYARKKGTKIYNASEVSFIDAFERKSLN